MLLDFHTHNELKSQNVERIFNVILNESTLKNQTWIANEPLSIGIHPWYVDLNKLSDYYVFLHDYGKRAEVRYIGEIGLDKIRGLDFETQRDVFIEQIKIAEAVNKPVVVHCVRAFNELVVLKKQLKPKVPMVVHGFGKKRELALELIQNGFSLSFGKDLLLKQYLSQVLQSIPLQKMFFETDDSNEICIEEVYSKAAEVLGLSQEELEERIYQNYRDLYI